MLGDIIRAGANLAAGWMGMQSQKDANAINAANAANNIAMQKKFAQEGIRWRVRDAQAAGIHPLFALGASTSSFAPVSVGAVADKSMPAAVAAMGQDIGRAVNATRTDDERMKALNDAVVSLRLENMQLDNDIKKAALASQVQRFRQNANPPMAKATGGAGVDETSPFVVPQDKKIEERPPLMMWGGRVRTPSGTSPMKAFEDQFGDDGPISWLLQAMVAGHVGVHNITTRAFDYGRSRIQRGGGSGW